MMGTRCWLEIDLSILRKNWTMIHHLLQPGCTPVGVVKHNGYGLGAIPIARELERLGCPLLSTAGLTEALELRQAGIRAPILLLGPIDPACTSAAMEHNVIVPVVDLEHGRLMDEEARRAGGRLRTHIKVDAGLNRLGVPVLGREEEALAEIEAILALPGLTNEGLTTHISGMMDPAYDYLSLRQLELFRQLTRRLAQRGFSLKAHCESSLPLLAHPEYQMDYVRLTSALLGLQPGYEALGVRCAVQLKTSLLQIKQVPKGSSIGYRMTYTAPRDMTIGIAGIGYGDGLSRSLTTGAKMSVRGREADVLGKLSMSFAVIDLTDIPEAALGDTVTVFGYGEGVPSVQDYAALYGGHACEVTSLLKERIPKVYSQRS
ncbi:MAG: alanine racemase [Oscillibacter sp.]|nr:alanine racemase [Oscillibacter sp.]